MADKYEGIYAVTISSTLGGVETPLCYRVDEIVLGGEFDVTEEEGCINDRSSSYARGNKKFNPLDFDTFYKPDAIGDAAKTFLQDAYNATEDADQDFFINVELTDRDTTVGEVGVKGTIKHVKVKIMMFGDTFKKNGWHLSNVKTQQLEEPTETAAVAGTAV